MRKTKWYTKPIRRCERSVAILVALALVLSLGIVAVPMAGKVGANAATTFTFPGDSVTTGAGAWCGGSGTVYSVPFDLTAGDLTLYVYDLDMKDSRTRNWTCPYPGPPLPDPTFKTLFQFGITNKTSVGPCINPFESAWQNLTWAGWYQALYYLGQQWYLDDTGAGWPGPPWYGPSLGWNTPYLGTPPNGGYHCTGDPEYDTFDLKIVFHDLGAGNGFRVTAYQRVHKTTDPWANAAMTWFPMYDAPGYQDVPEAAMDKTNVKPFSLVGNGEFAAGGGTITWGDVEATGFPTPQAEVWVDDDWTGKTPGEAADGHIFGYDAFATIQDGIDAVEGSTVNVAAGTYDEEVTINKSLTLLGAQANVEPRALVNGIPSGGLRTGDESVFTSTYPVTIQASNVTVNGFEFDGFRYGINVQAEAGVTLENVSLKYNYMHSDKAWVGIVVGEGHELGAGGDGTFDNILITHNSIDVSASAGGDPYALTAISFTGATHYFDFVTFEDVEISYNYLTNYPDYWYGIFCGAATNAFRFDYPLIEWNYIYRCDAGINVGNMYNADINNNLFEDNPYASAQIGVLGGSVTHNTFKQNYPSGNEGYPSYCLTFWGTQWGFPVGSNNVSVTGNKFYFNNYADIDKPDYGARVLDGCDAGTIAFNFNNFYNGGAVADALALKNYVAGVDLDATHNWWDTTIEAEIQGMLLGDVDYDPWLGAPLELPAVHHETLGAGTRTVDASAEANTKVTLTTTGDTEIYVARYESQPFPDEEFPDEALGKYIDIHVSNPDAVEWPIYVEVTYTDAEVAAAGIDEDTLGLYYYELVDTFHRCSATGADTVEKFIWANVTRDEAGYGTAYGAGGSPPPPPPRVPTVNQWGIFALITLFTGLLVWTVRRRRLAS